MNNFEAPRICLLDPGLMDQDGSPSTNLGDLIIQSAVTREIRSLFPDASVERYSTHSPLGKGQLASLAKFDLIVVGGTNLLSSKLRPYNRWSDLYKCWSNQWSISIIDALCLHRAVLLGVGWQQYQEQPDFFSKLMMRVALDGNLPHSVRDGYSKKMLATAGVTNVLNTACVTMWPFADADQRNFRAAKAPNALLMLTDYAQDPASDRQLLKLLSESYDKVYAWPQGSHDAGYLQELGFEGTLLEHSYRALEDFLASGIEFDYIGTRLHGGIRCLLAGHRALIIEVDNRAREIALDTGLPTVPRGALDEIRAWIDHGGVPEIKVPRDAIEQWRRSVRAATYRGLVPMQRSA